MISLLNIVLLTFLMLTLVVFIILFVVYYNKKQIEQKVKLREIEAEMQRKLLENSLAVQEEVRRTIAKDLHDEIGAMLSATKMGFNMLTRKIKDDAETFEQFGKAKSLLEDSISSVRRISKELLPSTLENFGLVPAIEDFFQKINTSSAIKILFESNLIQDERLANQKELMLFRIVQELTNNAIKHANATTISVSLKKDLKFIQLQFSDNGKGFNFDEIENSPKSGLGLNNIKSRVSVVKGSFSIESKTNEGTTFKIQVPLSQK